MQDSPAAPKDLVQRVEDVLAEELYWFPVRHHSATVARHLDAAIRQRKPKVVFIEGPSEANDLVPYIVDRKTTPPVAIYSSYRDDDNVLGLAGIASPAPDSPARFACWYPLLEYSPEYVAMCSARKIGAEVVFIDLPHYALISPAAEAEQDAPTESNDSQEEQSEDESSPAPRHMLERESERLIADSDFYLQLANAGGYKTWDEGWDCLFEFGRVHDDVEAFRHELATFCAAARSTCAPSRIAVDGTLPRERCMWQTIRDHLSKSKLKPAQAMVVCGGFHLFLDRDDDTPPPEPPAGTVYSTVVPYSHFQVSELSGYAAGNRAPRFYGMHWETVCGKRDDLATDYTVGVLKQARKNGEHLSPADAIAVTQHARMLGALRGRSVPILDDLHDALITCCCKGDPQEQGLGLLKAIDEIDIGTRVGRVTKDLGRLPIVDDFHQRMEEFDFAQVMGREKRHRIELDKREEFDARRSAFLHRLLFLEVPVCGLTEALSQDFATGLIFREKWALKWSPDVETKLVEQNLYGDTIESAVLARLREAIGADEQHAGRTCERLVRAIDMDLPDLIQEVEQACASAIDADGRFVSLSEAISHLTIIERYAIHRDLRRESLHDLIVRCFDRACFAIVDIVAVPEEQQADVVNSLMRLADVIQRGSVEGIDRDLFAEHLQHAADETEVPFLRGAFLGVLSEMRLVSPDELAAEVSALARANQEQLVSAGEFLHGVMAASKTSILLGAKTLIDAIDELLRAAAWDSFLVMLPRMRAAFEQLHDRQRASVATTVAEHYGLSEADSLVELRTSPAAAVRIAEIDRRVAEIMDKWD